MTVAELIAELQGMNPDAEVRLAHQPQWPFEHEAATVAEVPAFTECAVCSSPVEGDDAVCQECAEEHDPKDLPTEPGAEHAGFVYIADGSQIGYLPTEAARVIGWSRNR
jgi:hypothetical protein